MSEAVLLAESPENLKEIDRGSYFEQRLFAYSPFGTLATTLIIFTLFAVTFVAAMSFDGRPIFELTHGFTLTDETRGALTLSLLICVALGLQRYSRVKDVEDCARYATGHRASMLNSMQERRNVVGRTIIAATIFGAAFAIVAMLTIIPHPPYDTVSFVWFFAATLVISIMFARGVVLTSAGNRNTRKFIDNELVIDLLRIDRLTLVGRSAARVALIWFSVSAVTCLFFTSRGITVFAVVLVLSSVGLGFAIFIATMSHMHHRIREAKAHELERVRCQIERLHHDAHESGDVAQRLQGLIAYEGRISSAPEWPFDQTIAARVGASALILTLPWFGQAVASSIVERVGQMLH